jgi:cobalt transporter subunit CbtB
VSGEVLPTTHWCTSTGKEGKTNDPQVRRPAGYVKRSTGLTEGDMTTKILNPSLSLSQRLLAGMVCVFLGVGIVFAVGLSQMATAHNAAHDTRHALGFPCH